MKARATICATLALAAFLASTPVAHAAARRPASLTSPAPLICIDPGHGGPFSNANANGLRERTVNLQIGLALRNVLLERGYRVIMTRETNTALRTSDTETWNLRRGNLWAYTRDGMLYRHQSIPKDDLTARTRVANVAGADLLISIHCNGASSRRAKGVETWASPRDILGRRVARLVQSAVVRRTRLTNRGAPTTDFYVLRWANVPSILVESAFISNRSDARFLRSSLGRSKIASGIADGVDTWFAGTPYHRTMPRLTASSSEDAAIAVSVADFPAGARTVVLARSTRATDTPGLAALAVRLGASLLMSADATPTQSTIAEIVRLRPTRVVLVGLEDSLDADAISESLETSGLADFAVERVEGSDRATLATGIAKRMGAPGGGRVILVNERDTRAQLAAAPIAAATGSPILLTEDAATGPAAEYLSAYAPLITSVLNVGTRYRPAPCLLMATVKTVRYSNSARVAVALNKTTYTSTAGGVTPVIASALNAGDVAIASAHAARIRQPVVMVEGAKMSAYTRLYLTNLRLQTTTFSLLGSEGSLPPIVDSILAKTDYY